MTAAVLAAAAALGMTTVAFSAGRAAASTQSVEVDGREVQFQMYALTDGEGSLTNYVKLRDVAHVLNGTPAKFSVDYNNGIILTTGKAYTSTGTEMQTPYSGDRTYREGTDTVWVDGVPVELKSIILTDDQGRDYTYFKLRDLGAVLGFQVDWSQEKGVLLETGAASLPGAEAFLDRVQGIWYGRDEESGRLQELKIEGNKWLSTTLDNGTYTNVTAAVTDVVEYSGRYCLVLEDGTQVFVDPKGIQVDRQTWNTNVFWLDLDPAGQTGGSDAVPVLTRTGGVQLYPQYQEALEQVNQTNLLLMLLYHDRYQGALGEAKRTALNQVQGIWYGKDEKTGYIEETQVKGDKYLSTTFDGNTYRHVSATISEASGSAGQYRLALRNWEYVVVDTRVNAVSSATAESQVRVFSCDPAKQTARGELVGQLTLGSALRLYPQFQSVLAGMRG